MIRYASSESYHTCHPLGIRYPSYSISLRTFLKIKNTGGVILRVSDATLHVCFILVRSSHVKSSPEALFLEISACSAISNRSDCYDFLQYYLVFIESI